MPFLQWSLFPPSLPIIALAAYGLGSIPFGMLLTALAGGGDIRRIGSGNIGATNVLRTGRKGLAAATLLLDAFKGFLAVLLAATLCVHQTQLAMAVAGMAAILGHCFPIWLGFRGGKGVATGIGTFWALCWPVGLISTILWVFGVKFSRISSVGALLAFFAAPLLTPALSMQPVSSPIPLAVDLITLLVWFRHYGNIVRLFQGTEPRIGKTTHQQE
ncbi:glycerol-3-phosphate 1-O-acyltransferase PlsY [Saccharibacter sp. 17.LH.SD]|uniref:glycerol-3-phosphate 1-O-acyltransferase PlsY n=1 Tax=Saccharibacter sp. 17.LH.SD TaxID=2689393 RepID=UPI0013698C5D|nr:glycerol-3-phosphate 1-O-acyltransferase PlsY [Saccharibacter sp. 17.LH.SD]MXV43837.1 glycerol-3-phosphate 1-O-acyltransferase PlsY [Saccharibacter sp. 17.LH.SD]